MSRQAISLMTLSVVALGAIAAYRAVKFSGAQATVQGEKVMGVAKYAAAAGKDVAVDVKGTAIVESGAAIAQGQSLIIDNQGRAIPASALVVAAGATAVTSSAANGAILTGADLPQFVFADALQAAAGAGEFIEVMLR